MSGRDLLDRTVAAIAASAQWFLLAEDLPDRDGFLQAVTPTVKLVGVATLVALTVTQRTLAVVSALALVPQCSRRCRAYAYGPFASLAGPPCLRARGRGDACGLDGVAPRWGRSQSRPLASTTSSRSPSAYCVCRFPVRAAVDDPLSPTCGGVSPAPSAAHAGSRSESRTAICSSFSRPRTYGPGPPYRTIADPSLRRNWRDSGHFVGSFLVRSLERGERVQRAARARGGTGSTPAQPREPLGRADFAFGLVVALAVVVVVA